MSQKLGERAFEQDIKRIKTAIGSRIPVRADNVSSPPTDAELDAAFGTPATVGKGFLASVDDNGAGSAVWLVLSDGTNWWYEALAKAA